MKRYNPIAAGLIVEHPTGDYVSADEALTRIAELEKERDEAIQTSATIASERACMVTERDEARRERGELRRKLQNPS